MTCCDGKRLTELPAEGERAAEDNVVREILKCGNFQCSLLGGSCVLITGGTSGAVRPRLSYQVLRSGTLIHIQDPGQSSTFQYSREIRPQKDDNEMKVSVSLFTHF